MLSNQYQIVLQKLDLFIRKYYKNQLIRGSIYCISLLIIFFLIVNFSEYFGHFNQLVRTVLFYLFILINAAIIVKFIIIPVFRLLKIGKLISHDEAAKIIGNHFQEVNDKLINTLQLKKLSEEDLDNMDLVNASIDQKIGDLKPISFGKAIDFSKNRKYLKFALPPLIILLFILVSSPSLITNPTKRLVKHNEYFAKELPFYLEVLNKDLNVVEQQDFKLKVKVTGKETPENVYLISGNNKIKLVRDNAVNFNYTFVNVQKSQKFTLAADDYQSTEYQLNVLPKPVVLDFDVNLNYPAYTGKKNETLSNSGDLIIPVGTKVGWSFYTRNTDEVTMRLGDKIEILDKNASNVFKYEDTFFADKPYSISLSNEFLKNSDSLLYRINVIPDLYPAISVDQYQDSVFDKRLYFRGSVKDDYGFTLLTFNYNIKNPDETVEPGLKKDSLKLIAGVNPQQFYYYFDVSGINVEPGGEVDYYFEIWDNDGIHGSKSSRSQTMSYKLPTLEEISKETDESNQSIKSEMEKAIKETQQFQKDVDALNKKFLDKKNLSWEDKQQVQQLLDKQKELQSRMEAIKKENEEKASKEQQFKQVDPELVEKQKQLEEQFDKLMQDEDLKKLFDELQQMLDQVNKDKVNDILEKMKLSNEDLGKMLDRNLELFKQLEFDKKMTETVEKLQELAKKQDELSDKVQNKDEDSKEAKSEQENINKQFDDVKKDLDELDKLNKDLEDPNKFDQMEEQQQSIDQDLNESQEALEKNQRNKASKAQKGASQKMEQMAQSLSAMQQEMEQEGMAEDVDALRDILENLIKLSFDQEDLLKKVNSINLNDPHYTELIQNQKNIKDDLGMVEDSLYALSKRQIMIEPFVNKEISTINQNIDKAMTDLNNRNTKQAAGKQQFAMTSINNLALMLSESLDQMMQMMQNQGMNSCKNGQPKPGAGQSGIKSMRQLQEQLNQQIEKMKAGMKKGGKEQNGKKEGNGQSMNEQLARAAAQQEAIRDQMRQYADQLEKEGQFGSSKKLKQIMENMDKTETDLVNKQITQETLMRQQEILTRLLESEKAELEREKEEKRESTEAKDKNYRNPEKVFKYNRQQSNEVELLKTVPPSLKPFYKSKVNQYFYNFEELLDK